MTLIKDNVKTANPTEDLLKAPYGMQGANVINNTAVHDGSWYCIISVTDNTTLDISGCTVNWQENSTTATTDFALITGLPYYGDFRALQLTRGSVIAYNK